MASGRELNDTMALRDCNSRQHAGGQRNTNSACRPVLGINGKARVAGFEQGLDCPRLRRRRRLDKGQRPQPASRLAQLPQVGVVGGIDALGFIADRQRQIDAMGKSQGLVGLQLAIPEQRRQSGSMVALPEQVDVGVSEPHADRITSLFRRRDSIAASASFNPASASDRSSARGRDRSRTQARK